MKKIMFNDKFQLTQAVLEGRKTQTRRIAGIQPPYKKNKIAFPVDFILEEEPEKHPLFGAYCWVNGDNEEEFTQWIKPRYKFGEIVAVAQSYADLDMEPFSFCEAGWRNKMFVSADLMPYKIQITNIRIEHLQDISDEDCLAEGISPYYYGNEEEKKYYEIPPNGYSFDGIDFHCPSPREAYAALIDNVSGKGTWESNPWVWVYDFELIK